MRCRERGRGRTHQRTRADGQEDANSSMHVTHNVPTRHTSQQMLTDRAHRALVDELRGRWHDSLLTYMSCDRDECLELFVGNVLQEPFGRRCAI